MINFNPTKPCDTCDDLWVWFAGEWNHAGTDFSDECPTINPEQRYTNPEQRKASFIAKYSEEEWNEYHV